MPRVGVFVCWCGVNIAKTVDVEQVAQKASTLPGVVYSTSYRYMCSDPGQELIRNAISEHKLDRVVVASCSPAMHETTFQRAVSEAGLNPYFMEMANIREQDSWVHEDRELATEKAFELIAAAVERVKRAQPLEPLEFSVEKKALVIGGGIAGIQAALDIAEAGFQVYLVEKSPSIGGRMAQFDKTFPTLDCAMCILSPKMVDCYRHPNIKILSYSEVEEVKGFVGNFEVTIKKKARSVNEDLCTGCGLCIERCPTKATSEFDEGIGERKAIYIPFPQAVPLVPVIDREVCLWFTKGRCGLCQRVCPAKAIDYSQQDTYIKEKFGTIIVATGADIFDASVYGEYGYGQHPDIITSAQLERMINSSGPTKGEIIRPSNGKHPESVVFIQCVGSRDEQKGYPYCSRVCCMYTAKHALLLKEHLPNVKTYIFYIDIRAFGKGYEEFVRRVQDEFGAIYIRGRVGRIYPENGKLIVQGTDTLLGQQVKVEADLVVLAAALVPRKDVKDLARKLNISTDEYGWLMEAHPKLRPVETMTKGIFLAGTCQFPKDIPDSVAQASAAASKAIAIMQQESLFSEPVVARVNKNKCVGCFSCKEVCPYSAIEEETVLEQTSGLEKKIAKVNPGLCQGCGNCASACRSQAIDLLGFTSEQLIAQLEGLAKVERE
ncbi:CoB--CoM heterodisulfide reductase iron-sulfur subunit A family protein [bacterium]|nr:CoB--CoM heterodisulfide reductase iron-sulfur subunit A family protein [bacterium]